MYEKHGCRRTPTYDIWACMKQRCLNPKNKKYPNYGGRGIKVCDRWMSFKNFLEDMGHKPDNLSLDRIDNDGDYYKENCKWSTAQEQALNRRKRRYGQTPSKNGPRMWFSDGASVLCRG